MSQKNYSLPPSVALHRYWISANRMRHYFEESLRTRGATWIEIAKKEPLRGSVMFMCDDPGIFMSHWYGALSAVIEGWKALKLKYPPIDSLLQSPHVKRLRDFRNGAFHFQPEYFSPKFGDFMRDPSSVAWVRDITSQFGEYFLKSDPEGNPRSPVKTEP